MLLDNIENLPAEYEPENKPTTQPQMICPPPQSQVTVVGISPNAMAGGLPGMMSNKQGRSPRPLSGNRNAKVAPIPMQPAPFGGRSMQPGQPAMRPMYPPPLQPAKPPQYASGDLFQAQTESRPLTSGGVEISMNEQESLSSRGSSRTGSSTDGNPGSAKRSKDEVKKARLLDNALKEARERRRQEAIARGEDPDNRPHSGLQETSLDGRLDKTNNHRNKDRLKGPTRYAVDGHDSGDSTTNLLMDMERDDSPEQMSGPPRDPTKMSIQDILKMKVAMNQGRPKKKIISA